MGGKLATMRPPTVGARGGLDLQDELMVENRPMMNLGLQGVQTRTLGPGRQVADKSFFLSDLKQRLHDILTEMRNMEDEKQRIEADNQMYAQYARKHENLLKEIRLKEGELADYNLALDKCRSHTDVADVREAYELVKERNAHERDNVDAIFSRAADIEAECKRLSDRIAEHYEKISERMGKLGEDVQQEYIALREESALLQAEIQKKERIAAELEMRVQAAKDELNSEAYATHARGLELKKEHARLTRMLANLEDSLATGMTGQDLWNHLARVIKDTNNEIAALDVRAKELSAQIAQLHEQLENKEKEVMAAKSYHLHAHQNEALQRKEASIQKYMEEFPTNYAMEMAAKEKHQNAIVKLLRHISKQVVSQQTLPTDRTKLEELKGDLSFKEMSKAQSETTKVIIEKELANRRKELQQIQNLDVKIEAEIAEITKQIEAKRAAMSDFKSSEQQKLEHKEIKEKLEKQVAEARAMRDSLKSALLAANSAYDALERSNQSNGYHKTLVTLEKKLATQRQTTESIADVINARKREGDYGRVMQESLRGVEELNAMHKAASMTTPSAIVAAATSVVGAAGAVGGSQATVALQSIRPFQ